MIRQHTRGIPCLSAFVCAVVLTGATAFAKTLDVTEFGARGDGTTLNTKAIQAAIDQAHQDGGGTVLVPAGQFVTGTLALKSNVELHLAHGAALLGSNDPDDYPMLSRGEYASRMDRGGWTALVYALEAENVALTGQGTIDGRGAFPLQKSGPKANDESRARNILFISCKRVRVTDLSLRDSGFWMQHYLNCEDVLIRGLRVWNQLMRNNDGIDLDGCRRVTMSDCIIDSDDDGLCFKSEGLAACEDIVITNCVISSHCNAIKMGTGSMGGFKRVTISNCVVKPSLDPRSVFKHLSPGGISGISLELVDGGVLESVSIDNVVMQGVKVPIYIRLAHRGARPSPDSPKPGVGTLRNVTLSNITAYETGSVGSSVTGIPGHCAENVTLRNIHIFPKAAVAAGQYKTDVKELADSYPEGTNWGNLPASGLFVRHVRGLLVDGFRLHLPEGEDRAPIWADDVEDLRVRDAWITGGANPDRPFVLTRDANGLDVQPPHGWSGKATAPVE
ncbi:MAG: right-handed parallel beta-helix repeat-containing protein [Pirellulales bacterium]|nr:right-handed parallel beta-helix repeat-containing protein [Pirellulales bacterium]